MKHKIWLYICQDDKILQLGCEPSHIGRLCGTPFLLGHFNRSQINKSQVASFDPSFDHDNMGTSSNYER